MAATNRVPASCSDGEQRSCPLKGLISHRDRGASSYWQQEMAALGLHENRHTDSHCRTGKGITETELMRPLSHFTVAPTGVARPTLLFLERSAAAVDEAGSTMLLRAKHDDIWPMKRKTIDGSPPASSCRLVSNDPACGFSRNADTAPPAPLARPNFTLWLHLSSYGATGATALGGFGQHSLWASQYSSRPVCASDPALQSTQTQTPAPAPLTPVRTGTRLCPLQRCDFLSPCPLSQLGCLGRPLNAELLVRSSRGSQGCHPTNRSEATRPWSVSQGLALDHGRHCICLL